MLIFWKEGKISKTTYNLHQQSRSSDKQSTSWSHGEACWTVNSHASITGHPEDPIATQELWTTEEHWWLSEESPLLGLLHCVRVLLVFPTDIHWRGRLVHLLPCEGGLSAGDQHRGWGSLWSKSLGLSFLSPCPLSPGPLQHTYITYPFFWLGADWHQPLNISVSVSFWDKIAWGSLTSASQIGSSPALYS